MPKIPTVRYMLVQLLLRSIRFQVWVALLVMYWADYMRVARPSSSFEKYLEDRIPANLRYFLYSTWDGADLGYGEKAIRRTIANMRFGIWK